MNSIRIRALAVLFALSLATPAMAQVQMNCVPVATPSPYPSDWRSTNSLCVLQLTNNLSEPIRCDLRARLEQTGGAAVRSEPRQFAPGLTVLPTQQIMDWGRLAFDGDVQQAMKRTGHLPAKPIRVRLFCENMVGVNTGNTIPDVQIEITIVPSVPSPPSLLTPRNHAEVATAAPMFTWTPVRLTTGQEVWYQLRLVRVLAGQSPERALEANVPVFEDFLRRPNLAYPAAAPRLEDGATYAWRVQSLLSVNPAPVGNTINLGTAFGATPTPGSFVGVGLNDGHSTVSSFVWRRPEGADMARRYVLGGVAGSFAAPTAARMAGDAPAPPTPAKKPWRTIVSPVDSIALALLKPRDDLWGPVRGDRPQPTGSTPTSGLPAPDDAPAPGSGGGPAMPAAMRASYGPMAVASEVGPGQGVALPWFRVSGTSVAAGEVYDHSGAGSAARPDRSGQVVVGAQVGMFGDRVKVPLQALVSGDQVSFRQSITQISLHPEFAWGGLHAGNVRPGYSRFSLSDASVMGGGGDIVRERWYAGGVVGRMAEAVKRDTLHATEPQFERNVIAGRVGWGRPIGDAIEMVVMRVLDDEGSVAPDSLLRVTPSRNTVVEARARRSLLDSSTTVQVEAAVSRFDRNVQADLDAVRGLAVSANVVRRVAGGEVGAAVDWADGGFTTLGSLGATSDYVEGRLHARRTIHDGTLRLGANVGLRRDDLSGTLGGGTRRRMLGAQMGWQPAPAFGADADLNVQASHAPETELRPELSDLTASFSVAPRVAWEWQGHPHQMNVAVSAQTVGFGEAGALGLAESRTTTVTGGWQAGLSNGLFAQLSGNFVRSVVQEQVTEFASYGPGVGLTLLGGRMQANLGVQVAQTQLIGFALDRDVLPNIDARWQVTARQVLTFRAGWRRYRTGANSFGNFDERQATVQYSAAL